MPSLPTRSPVFLLVLLALSFAGVSAAFEAPLLSRTAAGGGAAVPTLDVEPGCRDVAGMNQNTAYYSRCLAQERDAHAQLQKDWASFPESSRAQCLQLSTPPALPSYVTLQECLNTGRDAGKLSTSKPANLPGTPSIR